MDAEGLAKLTRFAERVLLDGRPLLEHPTELGELSRVGVSGWKVMARLENGEYVLTAHLQKGDEGAIVFPMSIFRSATKDQPAITGWIGTGSNRFHVTEVVDISGVLFHVGSVVDGGFHAAKLNTGMWRSDYSVREHLRPMQAMEQRPAFAGDFGPVIAESEPGDLPWVFRGRIEGDRVWDYFSSGNSAVGSPSGRPLPDRVLGCLEWGGEHRPGRPDGGPTFIRGVVRMGLRVSVHLIDGAAFTAKIIDVGHPSYAFFVAVMAPGSPTWRRLIE